MKDLKDITKRVKEKIAEKANVESVVGVSEKIKEKIDASGIKEKVRDVTEKVKVGSVVEVIQKGMSNVSSLRDKSILAFSKTCTKKYIELGETVTVTLKLQSRYETGVLDCTVTDEIPLQFELIGDMPTIIYQLNPREEKEYQYKIRANVGGHFSTRAMCEIENKFSLDDMPSNDLEIYVSPLSIQMKAEEMMQNQWKEIGFIFKNISKANMASITVSLKQDSKFGLDKAQTYNNPLAPNQSVVVPLVLKTQESGSVSLDLDVTCTDENGKKYSTEKNFLVSVIEADKTTTKVNIESIGEVLGAGAIKTGDVGMIKGGISSAGTKGEGEGEPSEKSKTVGEVLGAGAIKTGDVGMIKGGISSAGTKGEGEGAAEAGRTCPNCSNTLQKGWKICPFCGNKLELKCPNCNHSVEEGWRACPFCGKELK